MADITWQATIPIAAPVERVYPYLADLPSHAEWAQSVVSLALIQPDDVNGVGARYRTVERQAWQHDRRPRTPLTTGLAGDFFCEVTELVPNRRIAWRSWAPVPGVVHTGRYAFELVAVDRQTTRLTQTAHLHDNWLGLLVSTFVFKTTAAKAQTQWAANLNNIKLILEETPTIAPAELGRPARLTQLDGSTGA